ncbi:MAG: hypothetical protein N4A74_19050 [Carboxylicivirga sp.]|jgi:hypothetical protein|nr:hypothetical protein [Carboxylicivirga sp.]
MNNIEHYTIDDITFYKYKGSDGKYIDVMYFSEHHMSRCEKLVKKLNIEHINIRKEDVKQNNINFIESEVFQNIKSLTVNFSCKFPKLKVGLSKLTELYLINSKSAFIDFGMFPRLKFLSLDWSNKLINFSSLTALENLKIWGLKQNDLSFLHNCKEIKHLELIKPDIVNLYGLQPLTELREINIDTARKLQSLSGIGEMHKKLVKFYLWNAPSLENANDIGSATNIQEIQISKVKNLGSLSFLDMLTKLKTCAIHKSNVKVKNNDFGPLIRCKIRIENNK